MLKSNKIKEYRRAAKKLGIWDKDYSSIKKDLQGILSKARNEDYVLDILGGSLSQMILMARLAVYGESENELSESDLEALFSIVEPLENLDTTPYMLANGIESAINDLFPLLFEVMEDSKGYHEFELKMRVLMAEPSKLTTLALSYAIAIGICMRRYDGMQEHFEELNDMLSKILIDSDKLESLRLVIEGNDKSSLYGKSFMFSAMLSTALVECNLAASVSFDSMYDFMKSMDKIISTNKDMYEFVKSNEFKLLIQSVEKYHGI